jgi:hypothetical protein
MNHAQDRASLDAWAPWAKGSAVDERQRDELEDACQHSLERSSSPWRLASRGAVDETTI